MSKYENICIKIEDFIPDLELLAEIESRLEPLINNLSELTVSSAAFELEDYEFQEMINELKWLIKAIRSFDDFEKKRDELVDHLIGFK